MPPTQTTAQSKTTNVNVPLPNRLHRKLRVYCVSQEPELTMGEVIAAALEAYL
jgi:hypothetical protein